jgi:nicotinate-nucleotide pyrophosphorylase (carboxylating)
MDSDRVRAWLSEDCVDEDLTSRSIIPEGAGGEARILASEGFVAAGLEAGGDVIEATGAEASVLVDEGETVDEGDVLVEAEGSAHHLLAAERVALNAIGHLSGIATATRAVVDAIGQDGHRCKVLATRKTTPGLRTLEHAAVRAGGGQPHRADLAESVLVKENHLSFVSVEEAVEAARKNAPDAFVMVEAETLDEARQVARTDADGVLLDNFDPHELADIVDFVKQLAPELVVEASGGITQNTAPAYAEHADRVSLGSITHSARTVDVSMRVDAK